MVGSVGCLVEAKATDAAQLLRVRERDGTERSCCLARALQPDSTAALKRMGL